MTSRYILREELKEALNEVFDRLRFDELFVTCLSCVHWDEPGDKCGKYQQKPPAKVIVVGCPSLEPKRPWDPKKPPGGYDDDIPF